MKKFEYKFLSNESCNRLLLNLKEEGDEGWEACGNISYSGPIGYYVLLKREY